METCRLVKQHGVENYSQHELFCTWRMINYRCYSDVHTSFKTYGGAGIKVCDRWRWDNIHGFRNFLKDMGDRPEKHTVDRIDPYGDYTPSNCRWADKRTQQNNFRKKKDTESGHMGVVKDAETGAWKAQITLNSIMVCINFYDDLDEAIKAREDVLKIKIEQGDSEALRFIENNKNITPVGKRFYRGKTSKYYGVSWNKRTMRWRAAVARRHRGKLKQINLGSYDDEEEAYQAVMSFLEREQAILHHSKETHVED